MAQIRKPKHDDGPVNAGEKRLLDYLNVKLPGNYIVIPNCNFAITGPNHVMKYWEYDCIVVAPQIGRSSGRERVVLSVWS